MTHNQTARFAAASNAARASFAGLAALVTFTVLASVAQIADRQADEARLALANSSTNQVAELAAPLQVVVVTGKRA
jgi:hypothetical protein